MHYRNRLIHTAAFLRHALAVFVAALLCVYVSASSVGAVAGDAASYEIIGFSKDGRYMAYQTSGLMEAGPTFWSKIFFIDVHHNTWAAAPVSLVADGEQTTYKDVSERVYRMADSSISALGIVHGNTARQYINHLFTDSGVEHHSAKFATGEMYTGGYFEEYELVILETEDGSCDDFGPRVKIELTIKNIASEETTTLQKDNKVPESRGCPLHYRIEDVYVRDSNVIVFVNVMIPGWEGRSMRYMCITGTLPRNDK